MSLEHAILGFLSTGSYTGYDLKTRHFDTEIPHLWTADQAQVYRTLDRLETSRLVTSKIHAQRGRPDRKEYSITRAGRDSLIEWAGAPHDIPARRNAFLLQLLFASDLPNDDLLNLICTTRAARQQRLEALRSRSAAWARSAGASPTKSQVLERMTIDGALAEERAAIDWLDDCIDLVRDGLPGSEPVSSGTQAQRQLFGLPQPHGGSS
ncbi:MAG: PadR family transcriptional regulator [Actinomycetota bacterium]|jgi:PadR family transcriptional regulator AphA|nr:PadR family transcriptional regulator [Actinomycetota bacterium]